MVIRSLFFQQLCSMFAIYEKFHILYYWGILQFPLWNLARYVIRSEIGDLCSYVVDGSLIDNHAPILKCL